ncbi:hypothetical protein P154DRAFT_575721 [Amniculicola lignicola CBS 123094]|uniref:NHL repeat-containing protein n=1 Tax=Amniculicola lignicola CBS 123094 TaxID=1392246 RepID=A0A6A5WSX6_9PLEO|nr:hypothetical protein P154DRAFT_575721 [Amniculicola lignicola CBS 123094]
MRPHYIAVLFLSLLSRGAHATLRVRQVATLPSYIENIAVRSNGHLLLTSFPTTSSIYTLDPKVGQSSVSQLPPIEGANGITGITEVSPDVFAIAAANFSLTTGAPLNGSIAIWTIDFGPKIPVLRKIVNLNSALLLNGLTTIPGSPSLLLASDSFLGVIFRIDITQSTYDVGIQDTLFAPPQPLPNVGINGIRTRGKHIYFANYAKGVFGRVPISKTASATGAAEVLAQVDPLKYKIDDFAIDEEGNAWVAAHPNALYLISTIKNANNKKWNNANPRGIETNAMYQKQVPNSVFCKYERCEAAHKNLLENAPLYVGAIVLGNVARLDALTMNVATGLYLGLRVVYVALYVNTVNRRLSYLRTLNWVASTAILFTVIIKAGNKMASQDW